MGLNYVLINSGLQMNLGSFLFMSTYALNYNRILDRLRLLSEAESSRAIQIYIRDI